MPLVLVAETAWYSYDTWKFVQLIYNVDVVYSIIANKENEMKSKKKKEGKIEKRLLGGYKR